jgi:tetratricopeptide (TPR) repeat protein
MDLAEALLAKLEETGPSDAPTRLGFAFARGDERARQKWLDTAMRSYATMEPGPTRALSLALLAGYEAPNAPRPEVQALVAALGPAIVPGYERSLNLQIAQTLLADALDDTTRLAELSRTPYPEVSELARAALARRAGDHEAAITALRASITASGDARFMVDQWWLLARELRATSDHAGVVAACDEVIYPRLMINFAWGAVVGDCLQWTAESQEALGKIPEARAAWTRLIKLRNAAPADDPLVTAAKTALARLPQQ